MLTKCQHWSFHFVINQNSDKSRLDQEEKEDIILNGGIKTIWFLSISWIKLCFVVFLKRFTKTVFAITSNTDNTNIELKCEPGRSFHVSFTFLLPFKTHDCVILICSKLFFFNLNQFFFYIICIIKKIVANYWIQHFLTYHYSWKNLLSEWLLPKMEGCDQHVQVWDTELLHSR